MVLMVVLAASALVLVPGQRPHKKHLGLPSFPRVEERTVSEFRELGELLLYRSLQRQLLACPLFFSDYIIYAYIIGNLCWLGDKLNEVYVCCS